MLGLETVTEEEIRVRAGGRRAEEVEVLIESDTVGQDKERIQLMLDV